MNDRAETERVDRLNVIFGLACGIAISELTIFQILSWLIEATSRQNISEDTKCTDCGDATTMMIAGRSVSIFPLIRILVVVVPDIWVHSDTVAPIWVLLFYHSARHRSEAELLREE